jgi:hypothetical protein
MISVLIELAVFSVFVILQSMAIVGIFSCFQGGVVRDDMSKETKYQGMILYMMAPKFFEKYKYRSWAKPLWACHKCMSSFWGGVIYWPMVLLIFGFQAIEVLVFVWDVFILVYLNDYFYKKS